MEMSCFFAVLTDKRLRFYGIFTGFAEHPLWECRIFSFKNAHTSQKSRVFPFTFHLFLLLEALRGFGRLCEALGGSGCLWEALGGFGRLCRPCKVWGGF